MKEENDSIPLDDSLASVFQYLVAFIACHPNIPHVPNGDILKFEVSVKKVSDNDFIIINPTLTLEGKQKLND